MQRREHRWTFFRTMRLWFMNYNLTFHFLKLVLFMLFAINEYWLFNLCKDNFIVSSFVSSIIFFCVTMISIGPSHGCLLVRLQRNALLAFYLVTIENAVTTWRIYRTGSSMCSLKLRWNRNVRRKGTLQIIMIVIFFLFTERKIKSL